MLQTMKIMWSDDEEKLLQYDYHNHYFCFICHMKIQNSGLNFQKFSEKMTTSPGRTIPKCLEVSYHEFSLYLIFLPECLVKWFAFQKFPQFSCCLKTKKSQDIICIPIVSFWKIFRIFPNLIYLQTYKLSKYTTKL